MRRFYIEIPYKDTIYCNIGLRLSREASIIGGAKPGFTTHISLPDNDTAYEIIETEDVEGRQPFYSRTAEFLRLKKNDSKV